MIAASSPPLRTLIGSVLIAAVLAASGAVSGCGDEPPQEATGGETIEHVHGLGVNPADGSLFIATHTGLFRSPEGSATAERVGRSSQDTMGFTVVGPDRFLGSGHPGIGENGPSSLGLIVSDDAGLNWANVSLGGQADFHVLRYARGRTYAVNALTGLLMVSDDQGKTWVERQPRGNVIDLAVDPAAPEHIIVATDRGLATSQDGGKAWQPLADEIGLITWTDDGQLHLIDAAGTAKRSRNDGQTWTELGSVGEPPTAFASGPDNELFVAVMNGTVMASRDGGASWEVRSAQ